MALLKSHHYSSFYYRLIMSSSRFLIPINTLSVSPSPPSLFLKPRSSMGVRTLSTNRVLVPKVFMSTSASVTTTEAPKKKDGSDHYGSENIQILEGLDDVRKRPELYIGSTDLRGLHQLVYGILDNCIDEAQAGFASVVRIFFDYDGSCSIHDDGRGIPIDLYPGSKKSVVETVLTVLDAGGKFGNDYNGYKVSGGLHGVGLAVVNALSEALVINVQRDGKQCEQTYMQGKPHTPLTCKDLPAYSFDHTGTSIEFWPDAEIFTSGTEFDYDTISARARELAFLVPGLKLEIVKEFEDRINMRSDEYCFPGGLVEYVKWLNADKQPLHDILNFRKEADGITVDVAFQWCLDDHFVTILGYANCMNTVDDGTHIDGFEASLTRTLNDLGKKKSKIIKEKEISLSGQHVREGLTCVISVKLPNPEFDGPTKTRLGNPEVRKMVDHSLQEYLTEYLELNPDVLDSILSKSLNALKWPGRRLRMGHNAKLFVKNQ